MSNTQAPKKLFISGVTGNLSGADIATFFKAKFGGYFHCYLPSHAVHSNYNKGYAILTTDSEKTKQLLLKTKYFAIGDRTIHIMDYLSKRGLKKQQESLKRRRVFVCSKNLSTIDLRATFCSFGSVEDAYTIKDLKTKRFQNFGFVLFLKENSAKAAVKEGQAFFKGRKIIISEFKKGTKGASPKSRGRTLKNNSRPSKTHQGR